MSDSAPNTPPPIGEALTVGWNAVKKDLVPTVIASLCASIAGVVPGMNTPGHLLVSKKTLAGIKPEPGDGFVGFQKFADYFVIGLLAACGMLLCGFGALVTFPLFMPGAYFISEHNMTWSQAKDKCMEVVKPNLMAWIIFHVAVLFICGTIGSLACLVGQFVTIPVAFCAIYYAYDRSWGTQSAATTEEPAATGM